MTNAELLHKRIIENGVSALLDSFRSLVVISSDPIDLYSRIKNDLELEFNLLLDEAASSKLNSGEISEKV